MAGENPSDRSPWERDDWLPESSVPQPDVFQVRGSNRSTPRQPPPGIFGEPPPEDFADHAPPSRSTLGRKLVAAAIVLALLIGSAGALLRSDGDPVDQDPPPTASTTPAELEALRPIPPATEPPSDTTDSVPVVSSLPAGDSDALAAPSFEDGQPPRWATSTIAVPERLAALAPTEVVTLSQSNVVSVTEFPSGLTRSLDVSPLGSLLQLAVNDGTIAVFSSIELAQIDGIEPVVRTPVGDGIIFVQPWPGTGDFIVTTPDTGPRAPQQDLVLDSSGALELLDNRFVDESTFFSRTFSPDGDALVNAPGGVYAVDPAGASRRISTGTLLATGSRHWAIEECDDQLRCASSVLEWGSEVATPGVLEPIDTFGLIDPATTISPDGRSIVYRADSDGSGRRRILDVATGTSVEAGRINQLVYPDSWAADSSGVFVAGQVLQFIDRTTGAVTTIDDLGPIRAVAVGSALP